MEERSSVPYFLLGLGLGVAAGVLLAPKSGSETREYIRTKAGEQGDYLRARADESREYVKRRSEDLRSGAVDAVERGKSTLNRHKENLTAAVEAGKQAYREAVANFESTPGGEGI